MKGSEHHIRSLLTDAVSAFIPAPADAPVATDAFGRLFRNILQAYDPHAENAGAPRLEEIRSVRILSAGMRSVVLRAHGPSSSVILKYFRRRDSAHNSGGFGYLREKHGLPALNGLLPGSYCALLFADDDARLLCLEDIDGVPLIGLSPRDDPRWTEGALADWCDFWVEILNAHPTSDLDAVRHFTQSIARADPQARRPGALPSPRLAERGLRRWAAASGMAEYSPAFSLLLDQLDQVTTPPPELAVFSAGDFSPHNLLLCPQGGIRGIDAEGACVHHRLLPVAELFLGFPSAPGYPTYTLGFSATTWLEHTQNFYERVTPAPLADLREDARVRAAVLYTRAVLAEQRPETIDTSLASSLAVITKE
ncbi:hypothetical protein VVR12_08860 [Rothia sp. LK2588]|uniref:hypothetical protein n=1 Tax=Rothia sp. LK2588 TaxID=3114369 RepID=UPI0034CD81AC